MTKKLSYWSGWCLLVTWPNIGVQAHPSGDASSGRAVLPLEPILVGDESDGPGDAPEGDR